MECVNCKYKVDVGDDDMCCDITHRVLTHPTFGTLITGCNYDEKYKDIESARICYNCKHWIGGGDWGLSCKLDYYRCTTDGFDTCERFEV